MKVIPFPRKAIKGTFEERAERTRKMSAVELGMMLHAPMKPKTIRVGAPWIIRETQVYRESLHDWYVTGRTIVSIQTASSEETILDYSTKWVEIAPGVALRKYRMQHDKYAIEIQVQKEGLPITVIWKSADKHEPYRPITTIYEYDETLPADSISTMYGGKILSP